MSTQQQQEECDRCGREDVLECQSSKCIDHDEEVEEVNCEWWGCKFSSNRGNIMTFFNATEKWVEENAEDVYDEYGRLDNFIDGREEAEEEEVEDGYGIGWKPGWCWSGCKWKWEGTGKVPFFPTGRPPREYFEEE